MTIMAAVGEILVIKALEVAEVVVVAPIWHRPVVISQRTWMQHWLR